MVHEFCDHLEKSQLLSICGFFEYGRLINLYIIKKALPVEVILGQSGDCSILCNVGIARRCPNMEKLATVIPWWPLSTNVKNFKCSELLEKNLMLGEPNDKRIMSCIECHLQLT